MTYLIRVITLLTCIGCSTLTLANDSYHYECLLGQTKRIIKIDYLQREAALPCQVHYTKDGNDSLLWSAQYEQDFCEKKAEELKDTLTKAGWSCTRISQPAKSIGHES